MKGDLEVTKKMCGYVININIEMSRISTLRNLVENLNSRITSLENSFEEMGNIS